MSETPLPSFKEQVAYVYNDYMSTLGGGERSALAYALALKELGFFVEILCGGEIPSTAKIAAIFGDEFAEIPMRSLNGTPAHVFVKTAQPTVFVNHTYMSFAPSPARIGIYSQMFPNHSVTRLTHPKEVAALASYRFMASNSSFTKRYTDMYWEYPTERSVVLHPPIGSHHVILARQLVTQKPRKERTFIHVGRFNPGNHNKNQKILIQAFLDAKTKYPELADWRFQLVGNVNQTPESQAYFAECQSLASKSSGSVEIHQDLVAHKLSQLMELAFGYVHGTGAFIPPGIDPHKCEHYGLSIVEAMAHGALPLVYARGGVFDVLEVGTMGIPYISYEGLVEGFAEIAAKYGTSAAETMQEACLNSAAKRGQEAFTRGLGQLISEGLKR